jgi:hypothetical protein
MILSQFETFILFSISRDCKIIKVKQRILFLDVLNLYFKIDLYKN